MRTLIFLLLSQAALAQTPNPAIAPIDRMQEPWWAKRHQAVLEKIKANPGVPLVLLGDSITQNYEKANPPDENFQPTWERFYGSRGAINLGYSGDRTEHVLWRLDHGEVDGIHPRAVVLMIGTNNTAARQTAAQTEAGIDAVVAKLREKLPAASILLLGILPNEVNPAKSAADREIDAYLARRYENEPQVAYLDIASVFVQNGVLNTAIYYDPRLPKHGKAHHPDTNGQRLMAEAVEPTLTRLMGDGARRYLATLDEVNTAALPVPRLEMDSYDWYQRHKDVLAAKAAGADPQVVLIGDSITHFWGGQVWEETFGRAALNLGFGWDRTQNVLWRLEHGEFDGLHPKTVVLLIGTNNLTGTANARANTPAEIVQGIAAIYDRIRAASPASRIVVMGVFPRGFDRGSPLRAPIAEVNRLLAEAIAKRPNTVFLEIGARFLDADGTLPKTMMKDGTHPTEEGYRVWGRALAEAGVLP